MALTIRSAGVYLRSRVPVIRVCVKSRLSYIAVAPMQANRRTRDHLRAAEHRLRPRANYDLYLQMARNGPIGCHPNVIAGLSLAWRDMSHDIKAMLDIVLAVRRRQKAIPRIEAEG
jgi:hypothetical protein